MKMNPIPKKYIADTLGYLGRTSTIDGNLDVETFRDNTLGFASRKEIYVIERFC
jgi:hypothetical protein